MAKRLIMALLAMVLTLRGIANDVKYVYLDGKEVASESHLLQMDLGLDHSLAHGTNLFSQMAYEGRLARWSNIKGGLRISTANMYQVLLRGDFKMQFPQNRWIGLRNQYTYSLYAGDNFQHLALSLMAVYDQEYFSFAAGWNYTMMASITPNGGTIWEPSFLYDANIRIFKHAHIWNLGMQICNIHDFAVERMYSPSFILNGNYRLMGIGAEHLNLRWSIGAMPAGVLHVAANNYYLFAQVGVTCTL